MGVQAPTRLGTCCSSTGGTPNPEGGGSEVYVERIAAELVARGHRATVFCQAHAHGPAEERPPPA